MPDVPGVRQIKRDGPRPSFNSAWKDPTFRKQYRRMQAAAGAFAIVLTALVMAPLILLAGGLDGEVPDWLIVPVSATLLGGTLCFGPLYRRIRPPKKWDPTERLR